MNLARTAQDRILTAKDYLTIGLKEAASDPHTLR
jgi:hypothetical protein